MLKRYLLLRTLIRGDRLAHPLSINLVQLFKSSDLSLHVIISLLLLFFLLELLTVISQVKREVLQVHLV